ncbi:MAG: polymorphic toxin type 30 domain-containing protein [Candidatus Competibacterales bacterium]
MANPIKGIANAADQLGDARRLDKTADAADAQRFEQKAAAKGADENAVQELALDLTQLTLDVAGIFDPTPISDALSGAMSLARGDWLGAGISAVSMVPYLGDLAKTGKLAKVVEAAGRAVDLVKADPRLAQTLKPLMEHLDALVKNVDPSDVPGFIRDEVTALKGQLDEFFQLASRNIPEGRLGHLRMGADATKVGKFDDIAGQSVEEILKRIPDDATERVLKPVDGKVQVGVEYKWVDDNGVTNRVRIHGPDPSAPAGSNAADGWVARHQVGGKYYDPDAGQLMPPGIKNPDSPHYNPTSANNTHIPIQTPNNELVDLMRWE